MNIQFYSITSQGTTNWYFHYPFFTKDANDLKLSAELSRLIEFIAPKKNCAVIRFLDSPFDDDDLILKRIQKRKSKEFLFSFEIEGQRFESELPLGMKHLGVEGWEEVYVSFNDFDEQLEELEPLYYIAMKHFKYTEKLAKHEWGTLVVTGKWIWWNMLAMWSDLATEKKIKWCLGDSKSMTVACLRTFSQGDKTTWPEPIIELFWNKRLPETEGLNLIVFTEEDLTTALEWTEVTCKGFVPIFRWKLISEVTPVVPQTLHIFREDIYIWMKKHLALRYHETGIWADYLIKGQLEKARELMEDLGVVETIPYALYEELIPEISCKSEIVWNNYIEYYKNK